MTQVLQLPIIQKSILLYFDVEFDIAMQRDSVIGIKLKPNQ